MNLVALVMIFNISFCNNENIITNYKFFHISRIKFNYKYENYIMGDIQTLIDMGFAKERV